MAIYQPCPQESHFKQSFFFFSLVKNTLYLRGIYNLTFTYSHLFMIHLLSKSKMYFEYYYVPGAILGVGEISLTLQCYGACAHTHTHTQALAMASQ